MPIIMEYPALHNQFAQGDYTSKGIPQLVVIHGTADAMTIFIY